MCVLDSADVEHEPIPARQEQPTAILGSEVVPERGSSHFAGFHILFDLNIGVMLVGVVVGHRDFDLLGALD